jgi:patatin-like phospholipase/acyl hydrolase
MPDAPRQLRPGEARSAGAIPHRRIPLPWPKDRPFRILSIDGGGIRGIFPAAALAAIERQYTGGNSVADYFDLAVGTSTGGIITLGLGAGLEASDILDLYLNRGRDIFNPQEGSGLKGYWRYRYNREALSGILDETFRGKSLGESRLRLCIPAFEGKHSEVYVFKTPHHDNFPTDRHEKMVTVALATAAAPTYFRPYEHGGYILVDGGVWANNPIMLGLVEALTSFDVTREKIEILSIGCGDEPYVVSDAQMQKGGMWHWKNVVFASMRLQSLAATNQARLLLGPPAVVRLEPPDYSPPIELDDCDRAATLLPSAAEDAVSKQAEQLAGFFKDPAAPYVPQTFATQA